MAATALTTDFVRALKLAHGYHADQRRKGTEIPYFSHLLQVAGLVIEAGGDQEQAIAALLHDAVEDAGSDGEAKEREAVITEDFTPRVARLVMGCTDGMPGEKASRSWLERKMDYLERLEYEADPDVILISVSDKLHNARAILRDLRAEGRPFWDRFTGGELGSLWYYRALVGAYRSRGLKPYVGELDEVVTAMEREAGRPDGVGLDQARAALAQDRAE